MASKKAAGSTKNGRDSQSKRLGVKAFWRTTSDPRYNYCSNVEQHFTPVKM